MQFIFESNQFKKKEIIYDQKNYDRHDYRRALLRFFACKSDIEKCKEDQDMKACQSAAEKCMENPDYSKECRAIKRAVNRLNNL